MNDSQISMQDFLNTYAPDQGDRSSVSASNPEMSMQDFVKTYAPDDGQSVSPQIPAQQADDETTLGNVSRFLSAPGSGIENAFIDAIVGGDQALAQGAHAVGLIGDKTYAPINAGLKEFERLKQGDIDSTYKDAPAARAAETIGNVAGNIAQFGLMGGTGGLPQAVGAGAAQGALQPTAQDDMNIGGYNVPTRALNAAIGGSAAGIGQKIGNIFSGKIEDPNLNGVMQTAEDNNIPVYRYQTDGGRIQSGAANLLRNVPFAGGSKATEDQVGAFQKALTASVGLPEEDVMNSTTLGKAADKMSNTYNDIKKNDFYTSPDFEQRVIGLMGDSENNLAEGLPQRAVFDQQVGNLFKNINPDGSMSGDTAKNLVSNIGKQASGANGSPQLSQLRSLINQQWASSMPAEDAAKLRLTDQQWRNMLALEKPVGNNPNGPIGPKAIQGGVKSVFGDYATGGDSDLENLSRLGQVIGKSFPDSGTAFNEKAMSALGRIGENAALLGGGAALGDKGNDDESVGSHALRGALGAGTALLLARYGVSPYVFSKMGPDPSLISGVAPGALAALANTYNKNRTQDNSMDNSR